MATTESRYCCLSARRHTRCQHSSYANRSVWRYATDLARRCSDREQRCRCLAVYTRRAAADLSITPLMTLCDRCHGNDASIFLTQVAEGTMTKMALCRSCGEQITGGAISPQRLIEYLQGGKSFGLLANHSFGEVAASHPQYSKEAFWFVRDGVDYAVRLNSPGSRHVTAPELLDALRSLAIERYGKGARETLASWGITRCEDFGEIVFILIDRGLFGKRSEDSKTDFEHGYDFETAFPTMAPPA